MEILFLVLPVMGVIWGVILGIAIYREKQEANREYDCD